MGAWLFTDLYTIFKVSESINLIRLFGFHIVFPLNSDDTFMFICIFPLWETGIHLNKLFIQGAGPVHPVRQKKSHFRKFVAPSVLHRFGKNFNKNLNHSNL